jgi:hypothetical protein
MNKPMVRARSLLSNRQWDREKPLFIACSGLHAPHRNARRNISRDNNHLAA